MRLEYAIYTQISIFKIKTLWSVVKLGNLKRKQKSPHGLETLVNTLKKKKNKQIDNGI